MLVSINIKRLFVYVCLFYNFKRTFWQKSILDLDGRDWQGRVGNKWNPVSCQNSEPIAK